MEIVKVTKKYGERVAIDKISFEFPSNGLLTLTGPSGSGKSTLVNILSGYDLDFKGDFFIDENKNIKSLSKKEILEYRLNNIAYIFQDFCLFEDKTIKENIDIYREWNQKTNEDELSEIVEKLDIEDKLDDYPDECSGGEQQRASIARALMKDCKVLIADEPTAALDAENATFVFEFLKKLSQSKLVIVISHDLSLAEKYADYNLELENGKIKKYTVINEMNPIKEDKNEQKIKAIAKFPIKQCMKETIHNIRRSPIRLATSMVLLVISFILLLIGSSMASFNKNEVLIETVKKSKYGLCYL